MMVWQQGTVEQKDQLAQENQRDVVFVYLPMAEIKLPSLALSLFQSMLQLRHISCSIDYANMFLYKQIGKENYLNIAQGFYGAMAGEYMFRPAAFPEQPGEKTAYCTYLEGALNPEILHMVKEKQLSLMPQLQQEACCFIQETAQRILQRQPQIVAIGSMFQQNNAMFALAKALKCLDPDLVILAGGCNCFDGAGEAIATYMPAIDYIFQGEADEIMADFCEALLAGQRPHGQELPYGIIDRFFVAAQDTQAFQISQKSKASQETKTPQTAQAVQPQSSQAAQGPPRAYPHRLTMNLEELPYPNYDDFFQTLAELGLEIEPKLYLEGSRGCWWGEKHQCTFCGLNGSGVIYRQKSTARLVQEMKYLLQKYPVKTIWFTDSVLSYRQMRELPQAMEAARLPKVHYFAEIKASASLEEIRQLVRVGIDRFQPGLESLNDHVLTLMNKGCRAIKQVETMKNYERCGAWFTWNLLGGFPGEQPEDYEAQAAILPLLSHLCPPKVFFNIAYHRSNVYETHRQEYGLELRPLGVYQHIYPLGQDFLDKMAYIFEQVDWEQRRLDQDVRLRSAAHAKVYQLVNDWNKSYYTNRDRLDMETRPDGSLEIMDCRGCAVKMLHLLRGTEVAVYQAAESVITEKVLYARLTQAGYDRDQVQQAVESLLGWKLLLQIGKEYLALAIEKI